MGTHRALPCLWMLSVDLGNVHLFHGMLPHFASSPRSRPGRRGWPGVRAGGSSPAVLGAKHSERFSCGNGGWWGCKSSTPGAGGARRARPLLHGQHRPHPATAWERTRGNPVTTSPGGLLSFPEEDRRQDSNRDAPEDGFNHEMAPGSCQSRQGPRGPRGPRGQRAAVLGSTSSSPAQGSTIS